MKRIPRIVISIVLSLSMLLGLILPASAAWDGYVEESGTKTTKILVDISNIANIFDAGGIPSNEFVKNGRYSAHWDNHPKTKKLQFTKVQRDWSDCSDICFDIYSEKAVDESIQLIVYTEFVPNPGKTISYFRYGINLNFKGWRHYEISVDEFENNNFANWEKVEKLEFTSDGWSCTPHPESDLHVNTVYGKLGEQVDQSVLISMDVSKENQKKVYSALGSSIAVMDFTDNIVKNGKIEPISKEDVVTTSEDVSVAPLTFFKNVLGAETTQNGDSITITLDQKVLTLNVGSAAYTAGDVTGELDASVVTRDGITYIPLTSALSVLGKTAESFDMLTVIGDKKTADAVKKSTIVSHSLKTMLNAKKLTADNVKKSDWKQFKDNWRKALVGDENNDLQNPNMQKAINVIDKNCETSMKSMHKDTKILALFGTVPCTESGHMTQQYNHLYNMAEAYGTYGSKYYKDEQVKENILFALEWLYENLYGQDEIEGKGWRSTDTYNWWDWFNGSAQPLTYTLLIMEDSLSKAQIQKYLSLRLHLQTKMMTTMIASSAASRLGVEVQCAALLEDLDWMSKVVDDYNLLLLPVEKGNGVNEDGNYITHNYFAYSTEYGTATLLDRLSKIQNVCSGTVFEFATPYKYNSCNWMYETFEPTMFHGYMTSAHSGRAKSDEDGFTRYAIGAALDLIGVFGIDDDIKLKQLVQRNVRAENLDKIVSNLSISQIEKLNDVLADTTVPQEDYIRNKVYYTGDSVMHQRGDFGFALSMSSSRIARYESINGDNMKGWYQSDGLLYTYIDTDPASYNKTFWQRVNPYHLPGTTVDTQERMETSIKNSEEMLTNQDFVGAAGFDDLYATAAMQLEGYNNDNINALTSTSDHGGDAPYHQSTLMAKKAWFMFDDEVVALGSDINADDGFEVQTVIENRKLSKWEKMNTSNTNIKEAYKVVSVQASADDGNVVENMLDGDYSTRWSAEGEQYAILELEKALPISHVGISFWKATDGKQAIFDLETSMDGVNWTKVWSGKSSGTTESMEAYNMKGTVAKYVKFSGHGRTNSLWNSLVELKIYPPQPDGSMPVDSELNSDKILGTEKITVDGNVLEKVSTYRKSFENPSWVHIEGISGYYLPQGGKVEMDKVTNSENFLEMWFTHGISPKKGSYAYVVLPKKTAEETDSYSKNPDIEILSNTEKLQAVKEKKLGITGMVFWEAGSFGNITVSQPMIVNEGNGGEYYQITAADPTQLLDEATLTVKGDWELVECDERCTVTSDGENTVISINFNGSKGRTLPIKLKVK